MHRQLRLSQAVLGATLAATLAASILVGCTDVGTSVTPATDIAAASVTPATEAPSGTATSTATEPLSEPPASGGVVLPLVQPNQEGAGAITRGTLRRVGRCLLVDGEVHSVLPVSPSTARWEEETQSVVFGSFELRVGARVTLGGGELALDANGGRIDWVQPPHPSCLPALAWFIYTGADPDP